MPNFFVLSRSTTYQTQKQSHQMQQDKTDGE